MRRICTSQRVDVIPSRGERRDALDQRWARFLRDVGAACIPVPNDPDGVILWLEAMNPDGIVLSGGNDIGVVSASPAAAPERDRTESGILEWAAGRKLPVLAVCRGAQMMNLHLGGALIAVEGHVVRRHSLRVLDPALIGERTQVNSYHNFGVAKSGLARGLVCVAEAADGTVEAMRHESLPWTGILWHPEREEPSLPEDVQLVRQFLGMKT